MKKDVMTAAQQRAQRNAVTMASLTLELHLRDLARRGAAGESAATVEFQQMLQYAHPESRARIAEMIDELMAAKKQS